jgi:hypothetical protein
VTPGGTAAAAGGPVASDPPGALAARFSRFAEREATGACPLYERLARAIAGDADLLRLAASARAGQPVPNLFLAAVHCLVLQGRAPALAPFYAGDGPPPSGDPGPALRATCLEHCDELRRLLATRLVQTNEVRRSACLFPAFALVARQAADRPLALVEVGASAGLNLVWDRYAYDYGDGRLYGATGSPVRIRSVVRGARPPGLAAGTPPIADRVGLDLEPLDLGDPAARLWLQALVWPGEGDRAALLDQAVRLVAPAPPRILAGDALVRLPDVLREIDSGSAVCVFHTHTANQLTPGQRARLDELLRAEARRRLLFRLSLEWLDGPAPRLHRACLDAGGCTDRLLAYCGPHGEWLEWRDGA